MDGDALLAQLLGMGFAIEEIERCQVAMATSSRPFSLQEATEWLLQNQGQSVSSNTSPSTTLVLTPPPGGSSYSTEDFQRPVSSSKDLSTSSQEQPLKSRLDLNEDSVRERERYEAREREEVVRKQRERKAADIKARQQLIKQIADDRKSRQVKSPTKVTPEVPAQSSSQPIAEASSTASSIPAPTCTDICRVQVRLPNGRVIRQNFPPSASLNDVVTFIMENEPHFSTVILVQPFPHHEFTSEEGQMSLHALGLYPSASLVVSKQSVGGASAAMETGPSHSTLSPAFPAPRGSKTVSFGREQMMAASSHTNRTPQGSGGHVLGYGGEVSSPATSNLQSMTAASREKRLRHHDITANEEENELMEIEESEQDREHVSHSDESDSGSDDGDENDPGNHNPQLFPPPPRNIGLPPAFGRQRGRLPWGPRHFPGLGGGSDDDDDDEMFEGQGHRLGGKEVPPRVGDLQMSEIKMHNAARAAAIRRATDVAANSSQTTPIHHLLAVPSLENLCTKFLLSSSRSHGFPSCASLTPMVAQRLLTSLMEEKRLNSRVLASFHGCPLQVIKLDSYCYATNELLSGLRYFQSLRHLSLGSCSLITDKAVIDLFPYLSGLTHLNLNGCKQLNEVICRSIRCCKSLEVLQLSQVKVSDRGVQHLLHQPLEHLTQLDLSNTLISSKTLALLPNGAPHLEILNIESTKVDNFTALKDLLHLHTLNVAHCQSASGAMATLDGCSRLHTLSLAGVAMDTSSLQRLANLQLHSLKLPDRNLFFDDAMEVISSFPLVSLDLMDYCHVTDLGIALLSSMSNLTHLSLSRTKLTDNGMPFIQGLSGLRELSLDNTLITDQGIKYIADLTGLDVLSLSDTRVTSQFILDGVLDGMSMLTRLNLSRTVVCDIGVMRLRLSSLVMLNLDWTCATELSSLQYLRENGCPVLETLRNRNIGQPLPRQQARDL